MPQCSVPGMLTFFFPFFIVIRIGTQSATFGPFDRQVVILNTDGKTFTLLSNPQAMRLKQDGFIKDRKFVTQPTEEQLEAALEAEEGGGLAGALQSLIRGDN